MAKVSKDNVSQVKDFGMAEDRNEELGGYTVSFVTIKADHDLGPILAKLPAATARARTGGTCSRARSPSATPITKKSSGAARRSTCRRGTRPRRRRARKSSSSARPTSSKSRSAAIQKAMQAAAQGG